MKYALLFFEDEAAFAEREHPERAGPYWAAWTAYAQAIAESGIMVSGAGLQPPQAGTSLRTRDGQRHVQDGPYAEAKEQLGGFFVIDVPDLDAALAWAARSPSAAYGTVEVRPSFPRPPAERGMSEQAAEVRRAAEATARASYGRLLAFLAARTRDVTAAEDALADAFRQALETWPARGIPARPEAWLMTAARRNHGHSVRHAAVRDAASPTLRLLLDEATDAAAGRAFPDERLKLLFVCAHPALPAAARTPLMLQTVLGLDAARIASAFLVAPAAMSQRLVRAKARIRDLGIGFSVPAPEELPGRVDAVLQAVYAAYGTGWEDLGRDGLAAEAVWLARLVVALVPAEPEARGLLALLLYCELRTRARRDPAGAYVPLVEQDVARWDAALIAAAEVQLRSASRAGRPGRFQLEAAVQSVHAGRATTGRIDWPALALLYDGLAGIAPTAGVLVSRAAVRAEVEGPTTALACLDALDQRDMASYQPYWAVRADLLRRAGRTPESRAAYARAAGLADDEAVRRFLLRRAALVD